MAEDDDRVAYGTGCLVVVAVCLLLWVVIIAAAKALWSVL